MTVRLMFVAGAAALLVPASGALAQAAPASWAKCSICHVAAAGKPSTIGPNLWGVTKRKAGTLPGFAYSPAMKKFGAAWTPAKLDTYLAKPMTVVPGTKMIFPGLPDAAQRAEIIAYLKTLK